MASSTSSYGMAKLALLGNIPRVCVRPHISPVSSCYTRLVKGKIIVAALSWGLFVAFIGAISLGLAIPSLLKATTPYSCPDDTAPGLHKFDSVDTSHGSNGGTIHEVRVKCTGAKGTWDRTFSSLVVLCFIFFLPCFSLLLIILFAYQRSSAATRDEQIRRLISAGAASRAKRLKQEIGKDFQTMWYMGLIALLMCIGAWVFEHQQEPTDVPASSPAQIAK